MGRRLSLMAAVLLTWIVGGCTGSPPPVVPPTTTPSTTAHVPSEDSLSCNDAIDVDDAPPVDFTVVLGVVALPIGRVLQTAATGTDPAGRLFAKQGLVIRIGALVDLRIGEASVGHAGIGWGNPGTAGDHVRVEATNCLVASTAQWVAFAGGYYVDEPMCVPIVVESGGGREVVRIAVGRGC